MLDKAEILFKMALNKYIPKDFNDIFSYDYITFVYMCERVIVV